MDAGALRPGDPQAVAEVLWAAVHGVVSLELAGHFPDPGTAAERFGTLGLCLLSSAHGRVRMARNMAVSSGSEGGSTRWNQ
jgi:hypothetical protein